MTWHPFDREVAEKDKGSARAEVLIILGVEGLAPCRHPDSEEPKQRAVVSPIGSIETFAKTRATVR